MNAATVYETLLSADPRNGWTAGDIAGELYETADDDAHERIEAMTVGALLDLKRRGLVFAGRRDGEVRWHAVMAGVNA